MPFMSGGSARPKLELTPNMQGGLATSVGRNHGSSTKIRQRRRDIAAQSRTQAAGSARSLTARLVKGPVAIGHVATRPTIDRLHVAQQLPGVVVVEIEAKA
eukprot:COSAG06_NODE_36694_length_444_cov_0.602899_1_plen_100_part_10